jgi:DMSO/TMAO reductase YedYZ heme-binding membrane subunit
MAAPGVCYSLAVLVTLGTMFFTYSPPPNLIIRSIVFAVQKGQVAFSLFALVMFVGAFGHNSAIRRYLNPIRAELSIIAAFLVIGHFALYLSNYISYKSGLFLLAPGFVSSFIIAIIMLILLMPLTITSFNLIKKQMSANRWKTVQRLAYPFFGLIFFHMLGYLVVPALNGSGRAMLNVGMYAAIFLAYVVLRIRRALLDRKVSVDAPSHLESTV